MTMIGSGIILRITVMEICLFCLNAIV